MKKRTLQLIAKRILSSFAVLFLMLTFIFFLLRISPGDPSQKYISPQLSPELAAKVKESFNLNSSLPNQYKTFLVNLVKGDLGFSYTYRIPVTEVLKNYLPFTIIFAVLSFAVQIFFSFLLAMFAVRRMNKFSDKLFSKLSLLAFSIPSFVLGAFLIFIFSGVFNLLPSSGIKSFDHESFYFGNKILDYLKHFILPLITLSLAGIAVFYKYLRENLEETFNKPFVLNLRSLGMSEKKIIRKHVIPNAIGPFISVAGVELGLLFSGALITEVIFGLPGMGSLTVNSILSRDYPMVIGCTFTAGVLIILSSLAADLIRAKLDKRVFKEILK